MSLLSFAGDVLSAGTSLFEGKKNRKASKEQFRAQMDESIQRRVADAEKAGVHPLFALGASVGASPTTTMGETNISAAGEALGRGIKEWDRARTERKIQERNDQIASAEINAKNAQAGRDAAEAALLDSQRARISQEMNSQGRDGVGNATVYATGSGGQAAFGPPEFFNPPVPVQKATGVKAGNVPAQQDYTFDDGRTIRTFSEELQADEIKQADILYQRAIHKGSDALMWFQNQLKKRGIPYEWMYK